MVARARVEWRWLGACAAGLTLFPLVTAILSASQAHGTPEALGSDTDSAVLRASG